mgnify:CR=1 FL=1
MESKNFDYKKLKKILDKENISVEQLAKLTGKTKKAVRPWLNGTTIPHKSSLEKILKVLHITEESISKDGISMKNMQYEVISETLDYLFSYFLPFFAYFSKNNENYQIKQRMNRLNTLSKLHDDSIQYRSSKLLFDKKITLDKQLFSIIEQIKDYVEQEQFPWEDMKKISEDMIYSLALEKIKEKDENIDSYSLYRQTCIKSIQLIEESFKRSTTLLRMLGERTMTDYSNELLYDNQALLDKHIVDSHMGIVANMFLSNKKLMSDIFVNELDKYCYFSEYYLQMYEWNKNDSSATNLPIPSDEFVIYLNWKIYNISDEEYAKLILESIDRKILSKFDFDYDYDINTIIIEIFDSLIPLMIYESRLVCLAYIKEHKLNYSLELLCIFEELPIQWTKAEEK